MKTTAVGELIFIPFPGSGHLLSMVELAKQLVNHDQRISIAFLDTQLPVFKVADLAADSSIGGASGIRLIDLASEMPDLSTSATQFMCSAIEGWKPHVREIVSDIIRRRRSESSSGHHGLAGFVVDMLCTAMIDVADEFGVPSYVFYPSGATFLDFMFHVQALHDEQKLGDAAELKDSESEMAVPSLKSPLPCKFLPTIVVDKELLPLFINDTRRLRAARGILVNTFLELEPKAVGSLAKAGRGVPPVFPVGPLLNLKPVDPNKKKSYYNDIVLEWLDKQPATSVVFLCFGSMGSFVKEQVVEIASALERGGHRFLWSLRRPAEQRKVGTPSDYEDFGDVLPEGFLDRTSEMGKVIGWVPQTVVLAHKAVGGFVSHCGWNSILESMWYEVPVGAWPMFAEQQLNAFQLVTELEVAEEIKIDYRRESGTIVTAEEIEKGISRLMDAERAEKRRKTMKEISEMSKKALTEDGSSYCSMRTLIQDMIDNIC